MVHGWISSNPSVGFWIITPSHEFLTTGPTKPELTSHVGPTSLSVSLLAQCSFKKKKKKKEINYYTHFKYCKYDKTNNITENSHIYAGLHELSLCWKGSNYKT